MRALPDVTSWHLVTGEYPPQPGGVSDYTALLAAALAAEVGTVHVWCPGSDLAPQVEPNGVVVHRVAGRFGPAGLANLDRALSRIPRPRTIVIQYTPHAFGCKAMNLPFALWAASRRVRGDDLRVMFHEVAYPWVRRPLRRNLIAAVNRLMAAILAQACTRAYVSIPGWIPILRRLGAGRIPTAWTPVPANVTHQPNPESARVLRSRLTGRDLVGHFGTYGPGIHTLLLPTVRQLLREHASVQLVLLGRGGEAFRTELLRDHPTWSERVLATGGLEAGELSLHLQACDLVLQPYPDGVSSRRGSVMAALVNGVPVVTTAGPLTEPIWEAEQAVAFAAPHELATVAGKLLNDPAARAALGCRGQELYDRQFALPHTVTALLERPNVG